MQEQEEEKRKLTNVMLLPSVKKLAVKRAKEMKRSFSSHVEFLLEKDLKESELKK